MSYKLTAGVLGRRRREKKLATEFIILVDTALPGSASDTMQLPIRGTDMTIDWGDGFVQTEVTQLANPAAANWITRVYPDGGGVKQIKVTGLDWIYFNLTGDRLKLLEIQNWGTGQWATMLSAFSGCSNMIGTFTDVPDLTLVEQMLGMFRSATNFNSDISGWNVSNVTGMGRMFQGASSFNQDISQWNTGNVTVMGRMFWVASNFNQDLSGWCVEKIASLPALFDSNANSWVYNANGDTGSTAGVDPATIINRPIWGTCPA